METVTKRYKLDDLGDFMRANRDNGGHYFDADTMRFFGSRLPDSHLYGGRFFVTSEKQPDHGSGPHPRLYSIREALVTGEVGNGGSEFQEFATLGQARTAARRMGKELADAPRCANCDEQLHFDVCAGVISSCRIGPGVCVRSVLGEMGTAGRSEGEPLRVRAALPVLRMSTESSAHTPGPWRTDGGFRSIVGDGGSRVADVTTWWSGYGSEQARADSKLIAAAPDLLAACEQARGFVRSGITDPSESDTYQRLDAAIRKATA